MIYVFTCNYIDPLNTVTTMQRRPPYWSIFSSFAGFQTAVFTLAMFATVFVLYVYVVYSLSSPPTLTQC